MVDSFARTGKRTITLMKHETFSLSLQQIPVFLGCDKRKWMFRGKRVWKSVRECVFLLERPGKKKFYFDFLGS